MEYAIWLPKIPGYSHVACFNDQARPLNAAFAELGYDAPIVDTPMPDRVNVVLGAHLLQGIPDGVKCIVWNLEQVQEGSPWFSEGYVSLLKSRPVWDYSQGNIEALNAMGITAWLLPVGYSEALAIPGIGAVERDIDFLHYGSVNQRRKEFLEELGGRDVKVVHAFGVYGKERDDLLVRAKVVVNLAYYESKIFNITRCSTAFSNKIAVVSEIGPGSEPFHGTGGFAEYGGLIDKAMEVLADHETVGRKGFDIFSQMRQADYLKAVLA